MAEPVAIRQATVADLAALPVLYCAAFPDEDLVPLVTDLSDRNVALLSLVAMSGADVIGHIVFTTCHVEEAGVTAALLGPLAVDPAWQRKGIGRKLVHTGLRELTEAGFAAVFVLGDPGYYARFGFEAKPDVTPPYDLPTEWREAWQSLRLGPTDRSLHGTLSLPDVWLRPELWLP